MPEVLRTGIGTHWQLPAKVTLRDPETWFLDWSWLTFWKPKPSTLTLEEAQLKWLMDELLAKDRTFDQFGRNEETLRHWLAAGAYGDPRCTLYEAIGVEVDDCD